MEEGQGGRPRVMGPSWRDDTVDAVQYGEMTPDQAEAEAARRGERPFAREPDPTKFDPMKEPVWTLRMAVAWIAYRDIASVRFWWDRYREGCWIWRHREWKEGPEGTVLSGFLLEQHPRGNILLMQLTDGYRSRSDHPPRKLMPVEEAMVKLRADLLAGAQTATGIKQGTGRRQVIPTEEWRDLEFIVDDQDRDYVGVSPRNRLATQIRYDDVTVPVMALLGRWPEELPSEFDLAPTVDRVSKGYTPLYRASQWIATLGGGAKVVSRAPALWDEVYRELLQNIVSGAVAVTGIAGDRREKIDGFQFADCSVELPFRESPREPPIGDESYLRSSPYIDDEHWRRGFDDSLRDRHGVRWSKLMVQLEDVFRVWPFGAVEPDVTGGAGRPSSMHLVEEEFDRRGAANLVELTLAAEARHLEKWLKATHPGRPRATAKTIETRLRPKYQALKFPRN